MGALRSSPRSSEPLDPAFTPEVLRTQLAGRKAAVKKVIMDQARVVGVGNIYANEALFSARIDPSRPASSLTVTEIRALHRALVAILERAIKAEGTTFRDYRTGTGQPGSYQLRLNVYGRGGEPCRRCHRRLVTTHSIDCAGDDDVRVVPGVAGRPGSVSLNPPSCPPAVP